ncbi:MAG: hypothetical protein PHE24_06525 [Patescibacteria group bacterium]|nr:hypothetical protein [Patescibacteria group bacterium]
MRAISGLIACVFASIVLFSGCSSLNAPNAPNSSNLSTGKVVHFALDFGTQESLEKTMVIGDSLTITQRKALITHLKSRISLINLQFKKVGSNSFPPTYSFNFPVKAGVCEGTVEIDSGSYYVECYAYGKIKVGTDSVSITDFQYQSRSPVGIGATDTTDLNISLYANGYYNFGLLLTNGSTPLNGVLDSLLGQGVVNGYSSMSGQPVAVNGYVTYVFFYPVKKNFNFYYGGKKYVGLFDITKGFDDDIVEVSVTEVKQMAVNTSVSFVDDAPLAITSIYPKPGDTIVSASTTNTNLIVHFNHQLASFFEMPNQDFSIEEVAPGVAIDVGTVGTRLQENGESVYGDMMSLGVTLKPGMQYICRISKVVDEYGNVLAEGARWKFATKP